MNGDEAKRLGERLLAEVEVTDLSEVLKAFHSLKSNDNQSIDEAGTPKNSYFNIPELDNLVSGPQPPILELVSPPSIYQPSGSGKTSLLYLIIATAILPRTIHSSISLSSQEAAVVLFDPLHHFSVARLAEVCFHMLKTALQASNHPLDAPTFVVMKSIVKTSLLHLHVFRPSSWSSFLSTLRDLPTYLFDHTQHASLHRRIHSLILEDIDAFVPSLRSTTSGGAQALPSASSSLTFQLSKLSSLLSAAVILTSRSTSPRYYRPVLPSSWPRDVSVTRLALRRVPVRGFAAGISVEEAEQEREKRWEVVRRARFECWKVGMAVQGSTSTSTTTTTTSGGGGRGSGGFVFRVGVGIEMERDK
ncbi:uncharacterized protein yc1106_05765 [Curvularia clavata]|uniref:Uncharacterized protein n=1 Tax=Curvularia clavata TaxID=95742 RepID=A0A9Q8Z8N3_CURCL|nr:uncharacterized protein yc1106_05765 [Curvularia clavata]